MLVPDFFLEEHFSLYEDVIRKYSAGPKKISKGTILHDAQAEEKISYYILDGIAALKITNETGLEQILFYLCKGSLYPINTIQTPLSMDGYLHVIAVTDLTVLTFPARTITKMLDESRGLSEAVIEHYVKYTNVLLCKILLHSYNDSTKCICSFLYLHHIYYATNDIINLTQEQIGQLLGLSRVQVARVFGILRQENIIKTKRNNIMVLDPVRLKIKCSDIVVD